MCELRAIFFVVAVYMLVAIMQYELLPWDTSYVNISLEELKAVFTPEESTTALLYMIVNHIVYSIICIAYFISTIIDVMDDGL